LKINAINTKKKIKRRTKINNMRNNMTAVKIEGKKIR